MLLCKRATSNKQGGNIKYPGSITTTPPLSFPASIHIGMVGINVRFRQSCILTMRKGSARNPTKGVKSHSKLKQLSVRTNLEGGIFQGVARSGNVSFVRGLC